MLLRVDELGLTSSDVRQPDVAVQHPSESYASDNSNSHQIPPLEDRRMGTLGK